MPLQDYKCLHCDREFIDVLAKDIDFGRIQCMKKCEEPSYKGSLTCPLERKLTTANFGDPVKMGHIKPDSGFTEQINRIKKANPRHRIK